VFFMPGSMSFEVFLASILGCTSGEIAFKEPLLPGLWIRGRRHCVYLPFKGTVGPESRHWYKYMA
jgi:hypothetical protein